LIEILDALFAELERQLTGWFGKKKRSRELIAQIRIELSTLKARADVQDTEIREAEAKEVRDSQGIGLKAGYPGLAAKAQADLAELSTVETERKYSQNRNKFGSLICGCRN
jgi:hypothetical protein